MKKREKLQLALYNSKSKREGTRRYYKDKTQNLLKTIRVRVIEYIVDFAQKGPVR